MLFADRRRRHSSQQEQERENKRDVPPRMPAVATDESDLEHCLQSYTPAGQEQQLPLLGLAKRRIWRSVH